MRIAAVDDQVVIVEVRHEVSDDTVNDRARRHEEENIARRFEFAEKIFDAFARFERHSLAFLEQ